MKKNAVKINKKKPSIEKIDMNLCAGQKEKPRTIEQFEFRILSQELKIWQEFAVFILFGTVTSSDKNVRVVP